MLHYFYITIRTLHKVSLALLSRWPLVATLKEEAYYSTSTVQEKDMPVLKNTLKQL